MKKLFKYITILIFSTNSPLLFTSSNIKLSVQSINDEVVNNENLKIVFPTINNTFYVPSLRNYDLKKREVKKQLLSQYQLIEHIDYTLKVKGKNVTIIPTIKYKNTSPIIITLIKAQNINLKFRTTSAKVIYLLTIPSEINQKQKEIISHLQNIGLSEEDYVIGETAKSTQFKIIGKWKYQGEVIINLVEKIDFPRIDSTLHVASLSDYKLKKQTIIDYLSKYNLVEKTDYKLLFKHNNVLVKPSLKYKNTTALKIKLIK